MRPRPQYEYEYEDDDDDDDEYSPISLMVGGAIIIAIGVGLLLYLGYRETAGGGMRLNAIFNVVYTLLGKWGVFALCALIGLGVFIRGALSYRRR